MLGNQASLRFSIIALVIGAIGAVGEGYLLHHELTNCLPFKAVDADFYQSIARTGVWLSPLVAICVGTFFVRKRFWLSLILPVLLTPLLFAAIFRGFHLFYGLSTVAAPEEFGDFTTSKAAEQFFSYSLSLAITGFVIGAVLASLLWLIVRPKKLP